MPAFSEDLPFILVPLLLQIPTATRDGIYTASYLGISPALREYLDETPSLQSLSPTARFLLASVATGSFAALLTQPVDTIKTRMQARHPLITRRGQAHSIETQLDISSLYSAFCLQKFRLHDWLVPANRGNNLMDSMGFLQAFLDTNKQPEYKTVRSTTRHLIESQGITALWAGLLPRLIRLCGATVILQAVRTSMIEYLESSTPQAVKNNQYKHAAYSTATAANALPALNPYDPKLFQIMAGGGAIAASSAPLAFCCFLREAAENTHACAAQCGSAIPASTALIIKREFEF